MYIAIAVIAVIVVVLLVKNRKGKEKVPAGIQVFSGDGKMQLNYTDGMCRVYGMFSAKGVEGSHTVSVPDNEAGRLFAIPVVSPKYYKYSSLDPQYVFLVPTITISGKTISWVFAHKNLGKKVNLDYSDTTVYFIWGVR